MQSESLDLPEFFPFESYTYSGRVLHTGNSTKFLVKDNLLKTTEAFFGMFAERDTTSTRMEVSLQFFFTICQYVGPLYEVYLYFRWTPNIFVTIRLKNLTLIAYKIIIKRVKPLYCHNFK